MPSVFLNNLSLSAGGSPAPLVEGLTARLGPGLTGITGANGAGKSTLLATIAGRIAPLGGEILRSGPVRLLAQAPDPAMSLAALFGAEAALCDLRIAEAGGADAELLARADWTLEARLDAALAGAGLVGVPLDTPLGALSGGEVRRAALAACLFDAPDIVLMDEPSNDLDAAARAELSAALAGFRGVAIVASHDRALLEGADAILALENGGGWLFGGGWSGFEAARAAARARAGARLEAARRGVGEAEARIARANAARATRDRQGKRERVRGGQPKILLDARRDRAGRTREGAARQTERLRENAAAEAGDAAADIARVNPVALSLPPSRLPPARRVLEAEGLSLARGGREILRGVSLAVTGPEWIALTGPNGAGKSTLLALLAGHVRPDAGRIARHVPVAMLDQQVSTLGRGGPVIEAWRRTHPGADVRLGHAALARMGLRAADGQRDVGTLSGGERLRAGLAIACGGPQPPGLLILDEPTNHLDLAALEALEEGLRGWDGALIVVSHDAAFRAALGLTREIALQPSGNQSRGSANSSELPAGSRK